MSEGGGGLRWGGGRARGEGTGLISSLRVRRGEVDGGLGRGLKTCCAMIASRESSRCLDSTRTRGNQARHTQPREASPPQAELRRRLFPSCHCAGAGQA